jgi:hypothetical protein
LALGPETISQSLANIKLKYFIKYGKREMLLRVKFLEIVPRGYF